MITTARSALLLSTTILAGAATAQEADTQFLGTLRIDTAGAQTLLGNAEITEEEIEDRNPASAADVFVGESSVTASGGAAIAQKVFVNGIEESLLSVTIDGARQNKSAFHHSGNVLLDPQLLKSVEVSEGIAPADAGPNALAGGLAYETKDARDFLAPGETFGGLTTLRAGTNGEGFRRSLTLFGRQGGFEWLLSGTRHTGDAYEDGDGVTVPGTAPDVSALVAKIAFTSDTGKRLSFAASHTEDTGVRSGQAHPVFGFVTIRPDLTGVPGLVTVPVNAYSSRRSYTLTYTDEAPEGWFAPTLQLSYNEQETDAGDVQGTNTSLSGVAKNEWQLGNGTVTAGIDFFHETGEGRSFIPAGPFAGTYSGREELTSVGLFAQARQDLTDRLSVSYGGRFDYQAFTGADGTELSDTGVSVNGMLDYALTDTVSLNAGLATSWGGYELGEAALVNFITPWGYAGFQASQSQTARVGLRYDDGRWSVSGALFRTEINDIADILPTGGRRGATSDLTSQGFDGSIAFTGARGFARLNYTYADVTLTGSEGPLTSTSYYYGRPMGHVFGFEAGYDVTNEVRLGGNAQIALADSSASLAGYEVVNVFASYKPESVAGLELRLDVENVFDSTYVRRSADGVNAPNAIALNEPGRTISLTATMRF
ncbi:TonB dependent-iron siderophore receptor [Pseudooceanicola batsensis HTCC2597]|uniref:TonB dependent-iron siderophore receptor n=1 Tax=Pseudooceanicola batsensis (strain ATCC BAA-863 / DSM 15984 / KCTC 12145 / HTCC2597) TaxID=252305 RepID=A3TSS7_PSEBH|nr:TonB-dependent receptor [Pseudooceanicola batsensis]EAQ04704.1 TonB dependent-iron siderophore receptor [Pseudooceanicola batsensis HTCC2597]